MKRNQRLEKMVVVGLLAGVTTLGMSGVAGATSYMGGTVYNGSASGNDYYTGTGVKGNGGTYGEVIRYAAAAGNEAKLSISNADLTNNAADGNGKYGVVFVGAKGTAIAPGGANITGITTVETDYNTKINAVGTNATGVWVSGYVNETTSASGSGAPMKSLFHNEGTITVNSTGTSGVLQQDTTGRVMNDVGIVLNAKGAATNSGTINVVNGLGVYTGWVEGATTATNNIPISELTPSPAGTFVNDGMGLIEAKNGVIANGHYYNTGASNQGRIHASETGMSAIERAYVSNSGTIARDATNAEAMGGMSAEMVSGAYNSGQIYAATGMAAHSSSYAENTGEISSSHTGMLAEWMSTAKNMNFGRIDAQVFGMEGHNSILMNDADITVQDPLSSPSIYGAEKAGIFAQSCDTTLNQNSKILTFADGVNTQGGTLIINGGAIMTDTQPKVEYNDAHSISTDVYDVGVGLRTMSTDVDINGDNRIETNADYAAGIFSSGGTLDFNGGITTIETRGGGDAAWHNAAGMILGSDGMGGVVAAVHSMAGLDIKTSGYSGYAHSPAPSDGIYIKDASSFTTDSGSTVNIETVTAGAEGIELEGGSTATLNGVANINTPNAYGIYMQPSTNTLASNTGNTNITSTVGGVYSSQSTVSLTNPSVMDVTVVGTTGAPAENYGMNLDSTNATLDGTVNIHTTAVDTETRTQGVVMTGGSNVMANGVVKVELQASGHGVMANGGTSTFKQLDVKVTGNNKYTDAHDLGYLTRGVYMYGSPVMNLENARVEVANYAGAGGAEDAIAVYANGGSTLNLTGNNDFIATDGDAMRAGVVGPDSATVNLIDGVTTLTVQTQDATGADSWHNGIENFGLLKQEAANTLIINHDRIAGNVATASGYDGREGGIYVTENSTTQLDGTTQINLASANSDGIGFEPNATAGGPATVEFGSTAKLGINSTAAGVIGLNSERGRMHTAAGSDTVIITTGADSIGISTAESGTSNIEGNLKVEAPTALEVADAATLTVNAAGSSKVELDGNLIGRTATTNGVMDVTLSDAASYLKGMTQNNDNTINLAVNNAANWYVTADSKLTKLAGNNNGNINMQHTGAGIYETITTEDYAGSGANLLLDTDLASETNGDKLVVNNGTSGGSGFIQVYDQSLVTGSPVVGDKKLLVVQDANGNTTWQGKSLDTGGLWDINPTVEKIGNDWFLVLKAVPDSPVITPSPAAGALMGGFDAGYGLWRNSLTDDTLRQRLGDLRYGMENKGGVWARAHAGKFEGNSYTSKYQTFQLGYDKQSDKTFYGVAVNRTSSKDTYNIGNGDSDLTNLSLYATTYHDSGAYSDVIVRAGRYHGTLDSYGAYPDSSSYKTWAFSASYEVGKTMRNAANGYFWEPEAQLVAGHMRSTDYTTARGVEVNTDSTNSLLGRVGVVAGRKVKDSDYYFKANLWHEFAGDGRMNMAAINSHGDRETMQQNFGHKDSWWELGIGGNIKTGDRTYVYGDILKTFGGDIEKKYQINAGIRWAF